MLSWLMKRLTNGVVDSVLDRVIQDPYTENLFSFVTIAQKLTPRAIVEATMRAESGKPIERPLGSPVIRSPWDQLTFNPVHLYRMPTRTGSASIPVPPSALGQPSH